MLKRAIRKPVPKPVPGPMSSPVRSSLPRLVLANESLRAEIVPELGGALARLDAIGAHGAQPLLRPHAAHADEHDPNLLACYPLVPWSNRIGGGQFVFDGRTVEVPRTCAAETLPIHGHGWRAPWQLIEQDQDLVSLSYSHEDGKPYRYRAQLDYRLSGEQLSVKLALENLGATLPFGMGLHPFFPRNSRTRLYAPAQYWWESGPDHLPVAQASLPVAVDFATLRAMPDGVDHAFGGWAGLARIDGGPFTPSVTLESDTDHYVLYTPAGQSFFCFEPVDHPINACNLPGEATQHGLTVLSEGETLTRNFRFVVSARGAL